MLIVVLFGDNLRDKGGSHVSAEALAQTRADTVILIQAAANLAFPLRCFFLF